MDLNILQSEYDSLVKSISNSLMSFFISKFKPIRGKRLSFFEKSLVERCKRYTVLVGGISNDRIFLRKRGGFKTSFSKNYKIRPYKAVSLEDFTIRLPKYGKALERFLEVGDFLIDGEKLSPTDLLDCPYADILINALGIDLYKSMHTAVIEINENLDPRIQAYFIKIYRQLTLYWYKTEFPYSEEQLITKQQNFVINDAQKAASYLFLKKPYQEEIKEIISSFLAPLTADKAVSYYIAKAKGETMVNTHNFSFPLSRARHSGGAVANLASHNRQYYRRYAATPSDVYKFSGIFDFHFNSRPEGDVIPNLLEFVPKDSRGPRMIAEEPDYMGLAQSYFQEMLYDRLEEYGIDLHNQDNNRFAALVASKTREFATIDMKNASDNILTMHIRDLFPAEWNEILCNLRSPKIRLKDNSTYELNCFATMGNKLTFPVQTIIFLALCILATELSDLGTYRKISKTGSVLKDRVLVYGDDIIVDSKVYPMIVDLLINWGFDVNSDKSFVKGHFRESCGIFAFKGYDVGCVYRRKPELSADHINELLRSNLYIENNFIHLPGIENCVDLRGSYDDLKKLRLRWNDSLHRLEFKHTVNRAFVVKHERYEDDGPLLDEWLRMFSGLNIHNFDYGPLQAIDVPRTVKTATEISRSVERWIHLDISFVPAYINHSTLLQQVAQDYAIEPTIIHPIIFGQLEFVTSVIEGDNIYNRRYIMKNYNHDFISGLSAINKKCDEILNSFKTRAEKAKVISEKASAKPEKADKGNQAKTKKVKAKTNEGKRNGTK